jgi:hypothetical protein
MTATQPHPRATVSSSKGKAQPHPRATARVPSPHQPYPRPYKDTLLLIGPRSLCKGGSGVERGGDPCGRPRGGMAAPRRAIPSTDVSLAVALGRGLASDDPSDPTYCLALTPRTHPHIHPFLTPPANTHKSPKHPTATAAQRGNEYRVPVRLLAHDDEQQATPRRALAPPR